MKKADRMAKAGFREICKARGAKASGREHKASEKVRRYNKSGMAPMRAGSITSYLIADQFVWSKDDDLEVAIEQLREKGRKRRRKRSKRK